VNNGFAIAAALLGAAAVVLGAFGEHALASMVAASRLDTWSTAVDYHLANAVVLLVVSLGAQEMNTLWHRRSCWLFLAGTAIFSGSLYLLVLTDTAVLGAITPIGGVLLIAGWLSLARGLSQAVLESRP
jgi:uncharacterized membrane protein YgdD (TMEM256/DUF423 family)